MRHGWKAWAKLGALALWAAWLSMSGGCATVHSSRKVESAMRNMHARLDETQSALATERARSRQLECRLQEQTEQARDLRASNERLSEAYDILKGEFDKMQGQPPRAITITRSAVPPGIAAIPGSLPSPEEELWVIQRATESGEDHPAADTPGSGVLKAKMAEKEIPVPLKHTDVRATITGYIAATDVTQQYHNPYDTKIEAVYVFPLPHNAAVSEFLMTIGDRKIRGIIREREEAKQVYEEARSQGYVASLLTQERPNVFTQSVANIEPGKQIDIRIRYFHTLAYVDGWYEYVFPMVVGPRFNPPGSTDGIGAVGRGEQGKSGQAAEVQYLRPDERSAHVISLTVHVDAGVPIEKIDSRNHAIATKQDKPAVADIQLASGESIPNKDFVLRFQVAGQAIKSAMRTETTDKGGCFTLMVYPPADLGDLPRKPLEMVFTLDVSGSMDGEPLTQGKAAIRYALQHMDEGDTFQVICFDSQAYKFADKPLPASKANVAKALKFLNAQHGGGGTMMIEGIKASLDFPHDENRLRFVSFLTDGYIGNEAEILAAVHQYLGPARIFSFGVGSSPNRYLLDQMARMGNGAVAYLGLKDDANEVMEAFFTRIRHPALTDISVDWGSMQVRDVYPQRMPDLFVGRPVVLTGRFAGTLPETIRIRGKAGDRPHEMVVRVSGSATPASHPAIPFVWARMKIADLASRAIYEPNEDLASQVKQTALEYGLMSAYTSFVAVDSMVRTAGDHGVTVPVPVPVPDGVKYETTVSE